MKLCFSGFDGVVHVDGKMTTVLQIENKPLFARVCNSLSGKLGKSAVEPYSLWDDRGEEINPSRGIMYIGDPLSLPWNDKAIAAALSDCMYQLYLEDDALRTNVERAFCELRSNLGSLAFQLNSDYAFALDWDFKKYLKSYSFGADYSNDDLLIDNLIKFLALARDTSTEKLIVFVNLKLFLAEKDLDMFLGEVFSLGLNVLLLENVRDEAIRNRENKYMVDQDFLETENPVSGRMIVS